AKGMAKGKQMVLVIGLPVAPGGVRRIEIPAGHQLQWTRWAGNRRLLASMSRAESVLGTDVRMTRLALFDLDTGKQSFVGPRAQGIDGDNIIHVDRDGRFLLLSTQASVYEYPSVYRVDLATGKFARVVEAREDVWNWYADENGAVRAGVGTR